MTDRQADRETSRQARARETGACFGHATTSVRTSEHMERCAACGCEVSFDLVEHRFFGFRAGCDWWQMLPAGERERRMQLLPPGPGGRP